MKRKIFTATVLFIIFGVPVFWYLFLQLFGENQFELPVIEKGYISTDCVKEDISFFYSSFPTSTVADNQFDRIEQYCQSNGFGFVNEVEGCRMIDSKEGSLFLLDKNGDLYGVYSFSILEIDRAMAEADLLNTIQNGADN